MSVARLPLGLLTLLTYVVLTSGAGDTQVSTREGENALLPCATDTPVDLREKVFDWKTGRKEVFMYIGGSHYNNGRRGQDAQFKDRAQHHPEWLKAGNASLILSNVTMKDSGVYECHILLQTRQNRSVNLIVERFPDPAAPKIRKAVVEPRLRLEVEEAPPSSGWVRLSCLYTGAHPSELEWHFPNGTVIPEEEAPTANSSYSDGRFSISRSVNVTEPGNYTCLARQQGVRPAVRDTIQVFGHWLTGNCEEVSWNVVEPRLRLEVEEAPPSSGWVRLSCLYTGAHPSELEWHFPNGTVIPEEEAPTANSSYSDGRFSISRSVKVTEPGNYTCLARQQGVRPAVRDTIQVFGHWLTGNCEEVSWNGTWMSICAILSIFLMLSFGANIYKCCTRKKKKKVDSEVKFIKSGEGGYFPPPNCDV